MFERHRAELDAILQEGFPKVRRVNDQIEAEVLSSRAAGLSSRRPSSRRPSSATVRSKST